LRGINGGTMRDKAKRGTARTARDAPSETLDYLEGMLAELRALAQAERLDMLAYLIDMAHVEAADIARGQRPLRVRDQ
jgi:hypothetical protein